MAHGRERHEGRVEAGGSKRAVGRSRTRHQLVCAAVYDAMSDYFLADDLSGAFDAAAAFHNAGRRVQIALSAREWPDTSPDDILGITTETRNSNGSAAAEIVRNVVAQARERGARLIYK